MIDGIWAIYYKSLTWINTILGRILLLNYQNWGDYSSEKVAMVKLESPGEIVPTEVSKLHHIFGKLQCLWAWGDLGERGWEDEVEEVLVVVVVVVVVDFFVVVI